MRKRIRLCAWLLVAVVLLTPVHAKLDDGGTEAWNAILCSVVRQRTMTREGEMEGFLTGTRVRLLWFEIYNDVRFVPIPLAAA